MAQTTPDAERAARAYAELWSEKEYARIPAVVSDSFVHETPGAPDGAVHGPDGVEAFMREIEAAFPDFDVTIVEMLGDDERAMFESEFTMTHEGEFDGIPPTGREIQFRSMGTCRVENGELTELREYLDMRGVLAQLGAADGTTTRG